MCVFNFSPGNVTGCFAPPQVCFGDNCNFGKQCITDCNDNCQQECGGMGWRRHGRWNDEEECVNECDATCSGNCRNNGGNNRILGGKYSLNSWILLIPIMFYSTGVIGRTGMNIFKEAVATLNNHLNPVYWGGR